MRLTIKELSKEEIPRLTRYWTEASAEYLYAMGADIGKLPDEKTLTQNLLSSLSLPIEKRNSFCLIWLLEGTPIGHCNTNPTQYGEEAYMHLHLWPSDQRHQGIGTRAVQMCVPIFLDRLNLKRLYCQPKAENLRANRVIEKCGFTSVKKYRCIPGSINYEQVVHQWIYEP